MAVRAAAMLLGFLGVFGALAGVVIVVGSAFLGATFAGVLGWLATVDGPAGGVLVPLVGAAGVVVGVGQAVAGLALWRSTTSGSGGARRWALVLAGAGAALVALRLGPEDPLGLGITLGLHVLVAGLLLAGGSGAAASRPGDDAR